MANSIIFSIGQEFRNGELFLIVNLHEKEKSRILYFQTLKDLAKESSELSTLLIQEHCKDTGISPNSHQIATLACNKIRVRASKSLAVFQKLIASKKLLWKERSLFFNPLSKSSLSFEVENKPEEDLIEITGFLEMDGKKDPLSSVDFLFLGKPVWGIHKQMVFVLPEDIRPSWVEYGYPHSRVLEGKQKERFLDDFHEDPPEEFPKTLWKGFSSEEKKLSASFLPVLPCLTLKDARGAFADLWMEYGTRRVSFEDPCHFPGRDLKTEKSWEKDLLETDFMQKMMQNSQYYCPIDKVTSSLSFLLEIGWKIIDVKGRRVMRASGSDLSLISDSRGVVLKGTLRYEDHKANVEDVVGAFNRRDRFLEISPGYVGLLDDSKEYEGLQDLTEEEKVFEGCLLRPKKYGLLESFMERSGVKTDHESKSLLERLKFAEKTAGEGIDLGQFSGELRSYQQTGVDFLSFLKQNNLSGLLADEMGLGKTVQALAFFSQVTFSKPILIIVPTSLVFNWKKEWNQFIPHRNLYVHEGSKRCLDAEFLQKQEAIITSYALLRIDFLLFQKLSFACTLLDEAQWIKNPESQLARAVYGLRSEMKICLTGTPIENKADDLWSIFHFLEPDLLGGRKEFIGQLSAAESDGRYKKRIQKLLRPFILRRLKEEVAQDLPEKMEQVVWVEMKESQRQFYEEWLSKTKSGLLKKIALDGAASHRMEILEAILRLRQICCDPLLVQSEQLVESSKLERVLEDLEEAVQEGRKILVYSQFTQMLQILKKHLREKGISFAYLDGETKDRESAVRSFQEDASIPVFLISLKAGGVGLNLTAADYVFLFDPWWNEAVERQAIDRAHRFGRKGAVIARRYIMADSIEEKMMKLKEHKVSLSKGLLNLDEQDSLGLEEMIDLL